MLEALKGKYVKGENLGVTTLRLRLQSAMEDLDQERPHWIAKIQMPNLACGDSICTRSSAA